MKKTLAIVAALSSFALTQVRAQEIRLSQEAWVRQKIANTWIDIHYRRPVARGRALFGGIVSWGQTWTPGADTATTITLSAPINIEDHDLPAGSYSIWMTTDSTGPWTVIFSKANAVWHHPYPGPSRDQLRFTVMPTQAPHMETLLWFFPVVEGAEATLAMHWGTTLVQLRIKVN